MFLWDLLFIYLFVKLFENKVNVGTKGCRDSYCSITGERFEGQSKQYLYLTFLSMGLSIFNKKQEWYLILKDWNEPGYNKDVLHELSKSVVLKSTRHIIIDQSITRNI